MVLPVFTPLTKTSFGFKLKIITSLFLNALVFISFDVNTF